MKARLSMAFQDLRGSDGPVTISKGRTSLVLRPRKSPKNPNTAPQEGVREYLAKASKAFKGLNSTQLQAWKTYAMGVTKTNPVSGQTYHPAPINAFVELASKFLQITPGGTIPLTPPTSSFAGDTVVVTADASAPGVINFVASNANAAGVKTELLLQPLPSANRTPMAKAYRHLDFVAYTSGTLDHEVSVPAGSYAAAYRFVKTATGQATEPIPLDVFTVTETAASPSAQARSLPQKSSNKRSGGRSKKKAA